MALVLENMNRNVNAVSMLQEGHLRATKREIRCFMHNRLACVQMLDKLCESQLGETESAVSGLVHILMP